MKKTIELKNLSVSFATNKKFLFNNTHYTIEENTLTFVQGKNGAGKSTFFKLLTADKTVQPHSTGTLTRSGTTYNLNSPAYTQYAQKNITLVPQAFDELLVPDLTFQENLACAHLKQYPTAFSYVTVPRLPPLAATFNIPTTIPVAMLSGGQRQILAILMTLERPTSLLLLDEPTATLDEENTHLVMDFLKTILQKQIVTILMICHDPSLYQYATGPLIKIE